MNRLLTLQLALITLLLSLAQPVVAEEEEENLLVDRNGDEIIRFLGFGDSIQFGVGDGTLPGQFVEEGPFTDGSRGYLARIRSLLGLPTSNFGQPGEFFTDGGIERYAQVVRNSTADLVGILEGTNDASFKTDTALYERDLQRAVNVARATGKEPLLFTLLPPCCNRAGRDAFTREFSRNVRSVAAVNDVALVDIERAWDSTCKNRNECELYNVPEGLHPNTRGYDVIGQVVVAALFRVDIFTPDGIAALEELLGVEPGTIIVVPDTVVIEEEADSSETAGEQQ